jgi:hypothetical protein
VNFDQHFDSLLVFKSKHYYVWVPSQDEESSTDNHGACMTDGEPTASTSAWASLIGSSKVARGSRRRMGTSDWLLTSWPDDKNEDDIFHQRGMCVSTWVHTYLRPCYIRRKQPTHHLPELRFFLIEFIVSEMGMLYL